MICIKIMIDHNRTFKDEVEKHVKEFLDLVKVMYGNLREVVKEEFGVEGEVSKPCSFCAVCHDEVRLDLLLFIAGIITQEPRRSSQNPSTVSTFF